jgi:hypothetical protein
VLEAVAIVVFSPPRFAEWNFATLILTELYANDRRAARIVNWTMFREQGSIQ